MGQMSAESIVIVADQFGITFNAMNQPPGIYKLVVNTSENPWLVRPMEYFRFIHLFNF
jgi:hypothetical protein